MSEVSLWFIIPAILLAALLTWWWYRNNPLKLEGQSARYVMIALMLLRFCSLSLLFILILGLLLQTHTRIEQKPLLAIAIDNTESLGQSNDAGYYKSDFNLEIEQFKNQLSNQFNIVTYTYQDVLEKHEGTLDFVGKATNISSALQAIQNRHADEYLSGIILMGDGLYNQGADPLLVASETAYPVYTVLMGDTQLTRDAYIKQVRYNDVVFAGNNVNIQVDISANGLAGKNSLLTIESEGKQLAEKNLTFTGNRFFETHSFTLPTTGKGILHYVIKLKDVSGEKSTLNNRYSAFITLIDDKQQILLLAQAPHPDLGSIQKCVVKNEAYACEIAYIDEMDATRLSKYNLIIAHQLPGWRGEGFALLRQCQEKKIPILFITGTQTGLNYFMQLQPGVKIQYRQGVSNEVLPLVNEQFSLFSFNSEERNCISQFPPLIAPYGAYQLSADYEVLFSQQIGNVPTTYPLWYFLRSAETRMACIQAEGLWKWFLADYACSEQKHVPALLNKTIQYLSVRKDKSKFVLQHRPVFFENEPIRIEAERYNESYELVQDEELTLEVTDNKGKQYRYAFTQSNKRYTLQTGTLPPGKYTYVAKAERFGKIETKGGSFLVQPLQLELTETKANSELMREIATTTGAKSVAARNLQDLTEVLLENKWLKPIVQEQTRTLRWIDLKWLFFLLLLLLSIEWAIRKWNGTL